MENVGWTAIGLFMVAVIFWSGYLTARVAHLEEWKIECNKQFDAIHSVLREVRDAMIRLAP